MRSAEGRAGDGRPGRLARRPGEVAAFIWGCRLYELCLFVNLLEMTYLVGASLFVVSCFSFFGFVILA